MSQLQPPPSTPKRSSNASSSGSSSRSSCRSSTSQFAVPDIPQRAPRPLTMSTVPNIERPVLDLDFEPTPGKLKRLSLVARPPSFDLGAGRADPSTPRTTTPRPTGMRSSISYSPAPRSTALLKDIVGRTGSEEAVHEQAMSSDWGRSVRAEKRRGETLTDRHADLLVLIAQKERRVNELRQELAQQESALTALKSRWTSIASRSRPPTAAPMITSTMSTTSHSSSSNAHERPVSASSSTSSNMSSLATLSEAVSDHPIAQNHSEDGQATGSSFKALLDSAWGEEGVLSPQTIEGGKRFWGALVRTVGAAAGGTVPLTEHESGNATLDLSTLKGMLPAWSLSPSPSPAPPEPANRHRLSSRSGSRQSSHSSLTDSRTSLVSTVAGADQLANRWNHDDLLSGGDEAALGRAITPRKSYTPPETEGQQIVEGTAASLVADSEGRDEVARLWEW